MRIENVWYGRRRFGGRARRAIAAPGDTLSCELPWGSRLQVRPDDVIGAKIMKLGLFDLAVCEMIARLAVAGDFLLDVGANAGQMTSLMAVCSGPGGKVLAFEPHPDNYELLRRNVDAWSEQLRNAPIQLSSCALGSCTGEAALNEPAGFSENSGLATLAGSSDGGRSHKVQVRRLDEILEAGTRIAVMKLDVEGFELQVLYGAERLLNSGRVRNVVFEDHDGYRSQVSEFLENMGFQLFAPRSGLAGPRLIAAGESARGSKRRQTNFLATRDAEIALSSFRGIGYACLRRRA